MNKYTGISFPFRLSSKGGVALSSTSVSEVPHISESIRQILGTHRFERCMEYHIYSDIDTFVFEPTDVGTQTLLKYQIEKALALEERITVTDVSVFSDENKLYANITYYIPEYGNSYSTLVEI